MSYLSITKTSAGAPSAGARQKEKMARIAGADYTDEASLKHAKSLITVDRGAIGGNSV